MIITWQGHSCFKIQDKTGSDGLTLVTDPYDKYIGLKLSNFEADIITVSHDHKDHNNVEALRGNPHIINSAGEYDIKGVMVEGILAYHDSEKGKNKGSNIIYRIEMDDITLCHLGDLGHVLENKQLEKLEGIDILFVPVGGKDSLDAKTAVEVISQIEPRIVIPMHYKTPGVTLDLDSLDKFVKELGIAPTKEEKLKINKKDLPQEDMELVVLDLNN
ncbi:MAG TPA: MBL fold metallo-hydrolase [bacterium]|nr:MBL fold metallo-hydrolase [bacterium]HPT29369.1 MBL fold metallo-hydrolase [bacterium]